MSEIYSPKQNKGEGQQNGTLVNGISISDERFAGTENGPPKTGNNGIPVPGGKESANVQQSGVIGQNGTLVNGINITDERFAGTENGPPKTGNNGIPVPGGKKSGNVQQSGVIGQNGTLVNGINIGATDERFPVTENGPPKTDNNGIPVPGGKESRAVLQNGVIGHSKSPGPTADNFGPTGTNGVPKTSVFANNQPIKFTTSSPVVTVPTNNHNGTITNGELNKNGVGNVNNSSPNNKNNSEGNSNLNESSISLGKELPWINSENPDSQISEIVPYTDQRPESLLSRSVTLGSKYNINFDHPPTPESVKNLNIHHEKENQRTAPQNDPGPKVSPEVGFDVSHRRARQSPTDSEIPQIKVPKLILNSATKLDATKSQSGKTGKGQPPASSVKKSRDDNLFKRKSIKRADHLDTHQHDTSGSILHSTLSPKVSPRDVSKSVTFKQENQTIKTDRRTEAEREQIVSRLYQIPAWKQKEMEARKEKMKSKEEQEKAIKMKIKKKSARSKNEQHDEMANIPQIQTDRSHYIRPVRIDTELESKSTAKEKSTVHPKRNRSRARSVNERNYEEEEPIVKISLTKCPICRNDIESPRSFPCLHTFCENCVSSYFSNSYSPDISSHLKCPVCNDRQVLKHISPETTNIAKALPFNHYVANMLAKTGLKKCNPCKRARNNTDAVSWCSYCAAPLCRDHGLYHQHLTSAGVHHVSEIGEILNDPDFAYGPGLCSTHPSQKLKLFCQNHQTPICEKCRLTTHRSCEFVTFIENEANAKKASGVVQNLLKKLENMEEQAKASIKSLNENARLLQESKVRDQGTIVSIKKDLTKEIDQKEKLLWKDLFMKFNTKVTEMKAEINSCERKRSTTRFYKSLLNAIVNKGSAIQILKELPYASQQIAVLAEKTHFRAGIQPNVTLVVHLNENILKIPSFGAVVDIEIKPKGHAQQVPFVERASMAKAVAKQHAKMPVEKPSHKQNRLNFLVIRFLSSSITGGSALGSKLMFADYTCKEIRGYARDSTLDDSLNFPHLPGHPWDITAITSTPGKDALMFTLPHERKIVLLERDIKKLNHYSFSSPEECYGITYADSLLIVACLKFLAIWHVKEGSVPKPQPDFPLTVSNVQYVHALSKNRIYFTNSVPDGMAYCITLDKTVIFSYTHPQLRLPYGITTDSTGNVFIAGHKSNNVHKLTPEGELLQIIAPKMTTLYRPRVLIECEKVMYAVHSKHHVLAIS